ncbi:MAG: hypothetical protein IPL61_04505 [Myxococcales bacterium]|nr:hypothetical protein [Myxococcales bacterium]
MSDYFMNDAELRQALSYMVKSPADVDGAMRKDPRLYPLMVNCVADGVRLNFTAAPGTTYADLPFGPKAYAIGGDKGQIAVMGTADQALLTPAPGGTFEVTRFDAHGLVATFSFTTRGDGATVSGTLDLRCALRTEMCRAAR